MDDTLKPAVQINTIKTEYRPIVFKIFYLIIFLTVSAELIIIRLNYHEIFYVTWSTGIIKLLLSSTLPMTILFRTLFIFLPRIYCKYEAGDEKLIMSSYRKSREILYSQIAILKVSTFSPRFSGGFTVTLKSGAKFRFPSLIKKTHLLLQLIHKARPELIEINDFNSFVQTSKLVEFSWKRIFEKIKNWHFLLFKFIGYPLILSLVVFFLDYRLSDNFSTTDTILALFLIQAGLMFLVALLFNHIEERINNRHILFLASEQNSALQRDIKFEKKCSIWIQSIFYILTMAVFLLFVR